LEEEPVEVKDARLEKSTNKVGVKFEDNYNFKATKIYFLFVSE
jgi:hypothetical protein